MHIMYDHEPSNVLLGRLPADFQIAVCCYLTAVAWDPWRKHTAGTLPQVLSHKH